MAKQGCRLQTRKQGSGLVRPQTQLSLELWCGLDEERQLETRDLLPSTLWCTCMLTVWGLEWLTLPGMRNGILPVSMVIPQHFLKAYCVSTPCWASRSSPSECVPGPRNSLWPDVCPLLHPCLCRTLCSLECCFPCSQTVYVLPACSPFETWIKGFAFYRDFLHFLLSWLLPHPPLKQFGCTGS